MAFIEKDFNLIENKLKKKIIQGSVIPRPVAWVSSLNNDNSINLAPFSYFSMLSPTMVSVSVIRDSKKHKDTSRNILKNKEAVIHIADISLLKQLDLTSKRLLENESEVELANLDLIDSKKVKVSGIKEAKIRLEVILEDHLELKNYEKNEIEADLLIFRVVYAHISPLVFDENKEYILHEKLKPIARLAGPKYAEIIEVKDFERKF